MTSALIKLFIKNSDDTSDPMVRKKYGYLGSCTGICLNVLLFFGKLIAGLISASISVMADAFNNLSDAGSSIMALIGFKVASQPADNEHPFGHGRMEYISGVVISFIIMLMGFELGKSSLTKIIHPEKIQFSILTLSILIVSVLVKLWMGRFNKKLGVMINSASMKAASADSISDCVATSAVILSTLVSALSGVNIDGYVGILVALFIMWSGFNTCKDSVSPLLGNKPDPELVKDIEKTVMEYDGICGVHDLIVNDYGMGNLVISMHAEVPQKMDFIAAHELVDVVEDDLKEKYKCLVTIHMDPIANDDEETIKLRTIVTDIISSIDKNLSLHDFRITKGENRENLIFDLVVPYDSKKEPSELTDIISRRLLEIDSKYCAVINIDRNLT